MRGHDDSRSDAELIRAADFEALYWRHRDFVLALAYRFTANQHDSLDVLQETFEYLFRRLPSLHLTASMRTFLYPVVKNLSLEIVRKRKSTATELDMLPSPSVPNDDRAELAAMLAILPQTHREVLLMRFVDDLKIDEIAAALQIPPGTVKSRLHNALEILRNDPRAKKYFGIQ